MCKHRLQCIWYIFICPLSYLSHLFHLSLRSRLVCLLLLFFLLLPWNSFVLWSDCLSLSSRSAQARTNALNQPTKRRTELINLLCHASTAFSITCTFSASYFLLLLCFIFSYTHTFLYTILYIVAYLICLHGILFPIINTQYIRNAHAIYVLIGYHVYMIGLSRSLMSASKNSL